MEDRDRDSSHVTSIPAGEEALFSAEMARSIRKFRTSRRLIVQEEDKDNNHHSHSHLLLAPLRTTSTSTSTSTSSNEKQKSYKGRTTCISAERWLTHPTKPAKAKITKKRQGWSTGNGGQTSLDASSDTTHNSKQSTTVTTTSIRTNGFDLPYPSTLKALRVYYSIHGDLVMPRRYVVPMDKGFPREWHGVDLANTVYNMKWWQGNVKQKPERVADLNQMGFLWERLQPEWNLVLEALITYSVLKGNVMVPATFVVPYGSDSDSDEQWPKATWGIPLGNCVYRIRHRSDFLRGANTAASRRSQLDSLGFVWDVQEHRFQQFYSALQHFARLEGRGSSVLVAGRNTALRVPSTFVVPKHSDVWPEYLWGYPLGAKCTAVRQKQLYVKGKPFRQQMLEGMGFQWNGNASLGWLEVVHAAAIYSKLHNRKLNVPYDFVVPRPPTPTGPQFRTDSITAADNENEVWPWPEYLWGLPLGQRLKDVRLKSAYLKGKNGDARRRQLDALGFVWKAKRGRPRKTS